MHEVNLSAVDLNLLVALRALLTERSVTAAAQRLGLSQPATSHALSRLRDLFADPLLVRVGRGLVLSPRAEALRGQVDRALDEVSSLLATPPTFDPKTSTRTFSIATSDYGQFVLLPPLLARLAKEAPGVDLWIRDMSSAPMEEWFQDGGVDVGVAPVRAAARRARGLRVERLFSEGFVCLVRKGHPKVKKGLTVSDFAELPHAFVAPRGTRGGVVDEALKKRGKARRIALAVPHFLVAPHAVARSDLIVTLAERVARFFAEHLPLRVLPPPLPLPTFAVSLIWHERVGSDPGHAWLRGQIAAVAAELE
jgi:DNA-binding transcriptional LysR family regulator